MSFSMGPPPIERNAPGTPWPTPETQAAARRAARMLWISGTVLCVIFGTCAGWAGFMATQPVSRIEHWLQASGSANADVLLEQYRQLAPHLPTIAVTIALLGLLPGAAYLVLSLPVRRGHRMAALTAFVLSGTQSLVAGLMLIGGLLASLFAASPMDMTLTVLAWGSLASLLAYTAWTVLRVVRTDAGRSESARPGPEPWDEE